jgi:hypothetical protein
LKAPAVITAPPTRQRTCLGLGMGFGLGFGSGLGLGLGFWFGFWFWFWFGFGFGLAHVLATSALLEHRVRPERRLELTCPGWKERTSCATARSACHRLARCHAPRALPSSPWDTLLPLGSWAGARSLPMPSACTTPSTACSG